jgi:hypothetical protein
MAEYLPGDTVALAGIHLDQVRNQAIYRFLPVAWQSALNLFREAAMAWIAYNGKDLLVIAAGRFAGPPAGTVLVSRELAVGGSPAAIRAAVRQRATHHTGAPELIGQANSVRNRAIWAVVRGDTRLPLSGNLENLNRMLGFTRYATASIEANEAIQVEFTGYCAAPEPARHLEESLRAIVTLAAAATRTRDLAALLKSIRIERDASTVHISLLANQSLGDLFR